MAKTADKALNEQQKKFVEAYTDAENKDTFLNHVQSYKAAGYSMNNTGYSATATKMLSKPHIKAAINKDMPEVAYNKYSVRVEYWNLYQKALANDNYNVAAKLLDSMAKTENMFVAKEAEGDSGKIAASIAEATKETMEKLKAIKEGKVVEFTKNGTD